MSTSSKRILAGAVALALCLSPAALAAKTEEPPLVAAVAGLAPSPTRKGNRHHYRRSTWFHKGSIHSLAVKIYVHGSIGDQFDVHGSIGDQFTHV